ncbi:TonB-dependent siderophore receptor [Agrobacterium sp. AGB01]|uniref:TonB-dependent siderophore receptor n=1 Tax=Agrobacterium sp. AGB01 TaxID=2769302 RepID=UPI0017836BED|nr:TonB-dependent siderophore receptor [Agrobacterium sp. AGB01]MBD9388533.1 TonB-dependent siderophore receptor [Agrobacterium sp. AGB01]
MGQGIWKSASGRMGRVILTATLLLSSSTAGVIVFSVGSAQAQSTQTFSIPAGSLNQALALFGRQARLQITYNPSVVAGKQTAGLNGQMSAEQAIARLLSNSDLSFSFPNATTVAIASRVSQSSNVAVGGSTVLDTISVQGQSGTTEGSGSYTTTQMSTATGLPLSIKETPQSVSVVTRQRLNDQVLNTTADVLRTAPGIQVQEWDGQRSEPFSRGFYLNSFQYDGVALNNLIAMYGEHRSDTLQYDRVEVLRGANGLLTGAGNPSGAVNFVRKHADSKELTGEVSASIGSWNNFRETLDITTPLNSEGSVRGRVIVSRNDADSHLDRQATNSGLFYGIIDADLGPDTKFSIGADHQHRDIDNAIWGGVPIFFSDGTRTNFRRGLNTAPDWAYWDTENTNVFSSFEHRFENDWTLKLDAIHVNKKGDAKLLYLWGQPDPVTGLGLDPSAAKFDHDATQTVVSAKLNGSYELFGRDHEFFSGVTADWMDEDYIYQGGLNPAVFGNIFDFTGDYPEPGWATGRLRVSHIDQMGAYAATRLNITDELKIIGGARFSHIKTETVRTWTGARTAQIENAVTPYVGITYDLNSNLTAYASYADVFRAQTERDINDQYLDPVTGSNIEAGIKGSWFADRLNGSLAVFRSMEDNVGVATSQYIPGTTTLAYTTAQGVKTTGIEAEISGELMPGWNLSLGATLLESQDADGNDVNTQLPREIVRLFTSYTLPGAWDKLTIGGGLNWQGTTFLPIDTVDGTVRYSQSPYTTVSLMARYKFNETFSAQLNVENVFDKRYAHMMEGDEQITFGAPRSAFLRLSAKF